jgi:hypothetical protein
VLSFFYRVGILTCFIISSTASHSQVIISEVMSSNRMTILDEFQEYSDWLEIANVSDSTISLAGYRISDQPNFDSAWVIPDLRIDAGSQLLIYASGKNLAQIPLYWNTIITQGDTGKYLVPDTIIHESWTLAEFNDTTWTDGPSGFGYGDGDDNTIIEDAGSVFVRYRFDVENLQDYQAILLHVDYDDAFVAYINGQEIARGNISVEGMPAFDAYADNPDHEASLYQGGQPESFQLNDIDGLVIEKNNLIAFQVHNADATSSDLTLIPFLSLGSTKAENNQVAKELEIPIKWPHTDFKIDADGDTLYLFDPSGAMLQELICPALLADRSFGVTADGVRRHYENPTPGKANAFGHVKIPDTVTFSAEEGLYQSDVNLNLSSNGNNALIYFTLDGSNPDTSSQLYEGPITIDKSTVVSARVVRDESLMGPTTIKSYILNDHDNLPVLSLVVEPEHFFDYHEGIYEHGPNSQLDFPHFGANFWNDWERPIYLEMYEPDGSKAFGVNAGTKIFGNWSRGQDQKSLGIYLRKSYGDRRVNYRIFNDNPIDKFERFVLRNSGNDWNNTMFRDALMGTMFHESIDKQSYRPAVLYINGRYWGIHNIREKINDEYLEAHYDLEKNEFSMLESHYKVVEGHSDDYINLMEFIDQNDLSISDNYQYVSQKIDIDNFIYYNIGNLFIDNWDWPGNNIKYWKEHKAGSKWRWIAYDMDFGYAIWDPDRVNFNTLAFATESNGPNWPNPPWSTFLLRSLLQNPDFQNRFLSLFADELNTRLSSEHTKMRLEALKTSIEEEIPRHMQRWSGSTGYWRQKVDEMEIFCELRPDIVVDHLKAYFDVTTHLVTAEVNLMNAGQIQINSLTPDEYPWVAPYFSNVPVEVQALPNPGYQFVRWEGDLEGSNIRQEVTPSSSMNIKAIFRKSDGDLRSVVINEIFYKSGETEIADWVELYNKGNATVDLSDWIFSDDKNSFVLPQHTAIASGEVLVLARDSDNFSKYYGSTISSIGFGFGLSEKGECLTIKNANGEIADEVCYESVIPWPVLNNPPQSITLQNPHSDNKLAKNWSNSLAGGTPGIADHLPLGLEHQVIELYPNPSASSIFIKSDNLVSGSLEISIFNLDGRKIYSELITHKSKDDIRISPPLAPGNYLIKIKDEGNNLFEAKLIRN